MGSFAPPWAFIGLVIAVSVGGAIALSLMILGHNPLRIFLGLIGRGRSAAQLEAEESFLEFFSKLEGVRHKSSALNAYSSQYFTTFQSAGWDQMTTLLEDLALAESALRLLMERRRYEDVRDVSRLLMGRLSTDEAQRLLNRYEGLDSLVDWWRRGNEILLRVVEASMESARKTASVGVSRKRSIKPTLVTLAELRSAISEEK